LDHVDRRKFLREGSAAFGVAALAGIGRARSAAHGTAGTGAARGTAGRDPAHRVPIEKLCRKLKGRLLLPGDKGYDTGSAPANGRYDAIRPLAVAVCADEQDGRLGAPVRRPARGPGRRPQLRRLLDHDRAAHRRGQAQRRADRRPAGRRRSAAGR
jgi:hypothetical protein